MKQPKYSAGWDEERVRRVREHYETQSDEEAVAEDETACEATTHTAMEVPVELARRARAHREAPEVIFACLSGLKGQVTRGDAGATLR